MNCLPSLLRGFDVVNSLIKYKNHSHNQNQCCEDNEDDKQFDSGERHLSGFQLEISMSRRGSPIFGKDKSLPGGGQKLAGCVDKNLTKEN